MSMISACPVKCKEENERVLTQKMRYVSLCFIAFLDERREELRGKRVKPIAAPFLP